MKVATTVLCDDKVPTISVMVALISQLNAHFGVKEGDRSLIKDVKPSCSRILQHGTRKKIYNS